MKDELFREATSRICGSLQLKEVARDALKYLREFVPAEALGFRVYDYRSGESRSVASVTQGEEPTGVGSWQKVPPGLVGAMTNFDKSASPLLIDDLRTRLRELLDEPEAAKVPGSEFRSFLAMPLQIGGERFGGIWLAAREPGLFNQEHADLVADLRKPFAIALHNALAHAGLQELRDNLIRDNRQLRIRLLGKKGELIGADGGLKKVVEMITQISPTTTTVLLRGETGVGKEVIATAIHRESPRADKPLVSVNCGAIPESLIESELFGHEKGSFTGADQHKRGLIEQADGGTLFLDEVAELSLQAQVKLLRFLQEKTIRRVGSLQVIGVDVRIIAATHRNMEELVQSGRLCRAAGSVRISGFASMSFPSGSRPCGSASGICPCWQNTSCTARPPK